MKKSALYLLLVSATTVLMSGCIYPFDADLSNSFEDRIVIGGDIVIGGTSTITVSRVIPLSSSDNVGNAYPSAKVHIESKDGYKGNTVSSGKSNGRYVLDTQNLDPSKEYRVVVQISGYTYVSSWERAMEAPEITEMSYTHDPDNVYLNISFKGGETDYFRLDYTETWEYSADYVPELMYNEDPDPRIKDKESPEYVYRERLPEEDYFYCWNESSSTDYQLVSTKSLEQRSVNSFKYRSIGRTSEKISIVYSPEVRVRCITPAAYAYLENLQNTSNNSGSLFAPVPSQMRGNVRNETDTTDFVIGYVSVVKETSDRYFLINGKTNMYKEAGNKDLFLYIPEVDEDGLFNFANLYQRGYAPVKVDLSQGSTEPTKSNVFWAPKRCTDCRAGGGTKTKPDYWPNSHE